LHKENSLKDIYYYCVGSVSDYLVDSNISNESIMSIILDIKVIYDYLAEKNQVSYINFIYNIKNIMCEYDEEARIILDEWINSVYIDKIYLFEKYDYNFIN
jgi:flagellar basal body P-ring protein FlgI